MVIFAAVGGRMSLVGAVYGALLVNAGKTYFSESFPDLWLFLMAALFIGVVLAFPNGLAGLYESHVKPWFARRKSTRAPKAEAPAADVAPTPRAAQSAAPMVPPGPLPAGLAQKET
jgi:urea transport system permease protein